MSVKREAHGAAGAYIDDKLQVGDVVDASAARGSFTLRPGDTPVVLLSAGIGATPVLAMLHALAAEASTREIWWLYGARNGREHPFAEETRSLLKALAHGHSHIRYSSPDPEDRPSVDFDAPGRLNMRVLQELSVPRNGDFYICGPSTFMSDLTAGLAAWGVAPDRIHTEMFGAGPSITPGVAASPRRPPHLPAGPPGVGPLVSFARSGLNVRWGPAFQSLLELGRSLRRARAMVVPNGGLPHLRDRACGRDGRLPPRPGRCTGGRQCADLLLATRGRRRHRFVTARGLISDAHKAIEAESCSAATQIMGDFCASRELSPFIRTAEF